MGDIVRICIGNAFHLQDPALDFVDGGTRRLKAGRQGITELDLAGIACPDEAEILESYNFV